MSLSAVSLLEDATTIVIKVGSSLLIDEAGQLATGWLAKLSGDIAALKAKGKQVILVSSGAVALGRNQLELTPPLKLDEKQAAAAAGQAHLVQAYQAAFQEHGLVTAQMLLTLDISENRRSYLNARATLRKLLSLGAVPVVNENDTVATAELLYRYGDNDRLSAHVAQLASADLLLLLSDVDGLYSANPAQDPAARHVPQVPEITPEIEKMAGGTSSSSVGTGGMSTKIAAARIATNAGCTTIIASGQPPDSTGPVTALLGSGPCTIFAPSGTPENARRQWISARLTAQGSIQIDDGAASALNEGASLLPAGVTSVSGTFEKGDAVVVCSPDGRKIARGLVSYSADEIGLLAGARSHEIPERLGYQGRPAIIHRDNLVLMTDSQVENSC